MSVRPAALILLLLVVTAPVSPAHSQDLSLTGLRTHDTYSAIVTESSSDVEVCTSCGTPIPVNEWLGLPTSDLGPNAGSSLLSVAYLNQTCTCRVIRLFPSPQDDLIILPPARGGDSALTVTVAIEGGPPTSYYFPISGHLPLDPRETWIGTSDSWKTMEITLARNDTVFLATTPPASANWHSQGFVVDLNATKSGALFSGAAYGVSSGQPLALRVSDLAGGSSMSQVPGTPFTFPSSPLFLIDGSRGTEEALNISIGSVGAHDDWSGGILLFSVNSSWVLTTHGQGSFREVGAHASRPASASIGDESLVVGGDTLTATIVGTGTILVSLGAGNTAGVGTEATLSHADLTKSATGSSHLELVRTGDCSGTWTATLNGTTIGGSGSGRSVIDWLPGFEPSQFFHSQFEVGTAWCD